MSGHCLHDVGERRRPRPAPRTAPGVPARWSIPSAVDALPCGSLSSTSTCSPACASAAARLTVEVVLPTPPFWFATVITRVLGRRREPAAPQRDPAPGVLGDLLHQRRAVVDLGDRAGQLGPVELVLRRVRLAFHVEPRRRVSHVAEALGQRPGRRQPAVPRGTSRRPRRGPPAPGPATRPASGLGAALTTGQPSPGVTESAVIWESTGVLPGRGQRAAGQPSRWPRTVRTAAGGVRRGHRRTSRTTVVGTSSHRSPQVSTSCCDHPRPPQRRRRGGELLGRLRPLMASTCPPGVDQRQAPPRQLVERRDGPRRDHLPGARPATSSARPRTTRTSRPRSSTTSVSQTVRRSSGSTSVTRRSGRASATAIPGSPAPLPTSTTVAPAGTSSPSTAQFSTCRVHSRGTSRGPISPRSTPLRRQVHGEPPRQPHLLPEDGVEHAGVDRLEVEGQGVRLVPQGCAPGCVPRETRRARRGTLGGSSLKTSSEAVEASTRPPVHRT